MTKFTMDTKLDNHFKKYFFLIYFWIFLWFFLSRIIWYFFSNNLIVIRDFLTSFWDYRTPIFIYIGITATLYAILLFFNKKLPIWSVYLLYFMFCGFMSVGVVAIMMLVKKSFIYLFLIISSFYLYASIYALFSKKDFISNFRIHLIWLGIVESILLIILGDFWARTVIIVSFFSLLIWIQYLLYYTQILRNEYIANKTIKLSDSIRGATFMYVNFFMIFKNIAYIFSNIWTAKNLITDILPLWNWKKK